MARKKQSKINNKIRQLITKVNPKSPISEQYRMIRTNIQFASVDNEIKSIVVTSPSPSEGKSTIAANLAVVYAQAGKKVLLVDADLRKPTVHYTFRLDNLTGLSNVLVGEKTIDEAANCTDIVNLDIISCGPIPPNPSELLASRKMEQFIREAAGSYDLVIYDTSPVLAVSDAQILANMVDGSILVVLSKKTELESAAKAKDILEPARAKLLGTVLNGREKQGSNYYYYYGTN